MAGVVAVAVLEYALKLPAASVARRRYRYVVDAVSAPSAYEGVALVPICANPVQPAP
jgi:hypothetical protein